LVNRSAGKNHLLPEAVKRYKNAFPDHVLCVPEGFFAPEYTDDFVVVNTPTSESYLEALELSIKAVSSYGCERIVAFGGDGFFNNIGSLLINNAIPIPLMGIGTGTANVGILTQFSVSDLNPELRSDKSTPISPLFVEKNAEVMGYAFHDIVIGDTFLGTVESKTRNISIKRWMKDKSLIPVPPVPLTGERIQFYTGEKRLTVKIGSFSQIILSPLYNSEFYVGKAITGLLCFSPYYSDCFGMALSDRVLVEMNEDFPDFPCLLEQRLFRAGERVTIQGIPDSHYIIVDGNPVCSAEGGILIGISESFVNVVINEKNIGFSRVNNERK
jgi:hypothetical protein